MHFNVTITFTAPAKLSTQTNTATHARLNSHVRLFKCAFQWIDHSSSSVIIVEFPFEILMVQHNPNSGNDDLQFESLPHPTLILVSGLVFFLVTYWFAYPIAEGVISKQFWLAVERGYEDHFEESDTIDMAMNVLTLFIIIPASLFAGFCGNMYSHYRTRRGYGRYVFAFTLSALPYLLILLLTLQYVCSAR